MSANENPMILEENTKIISHFTFLDNEVIWYCAEDESWSVLVSRSGAEENFRDREENNPFGTRLSTMFAGECVLLVRRASRSDITSYIQQVA